MPKISNWKVYGLEESIRASKYPMAVDIDALDSNITPRVKVLASARPGSGEDCFLKGIVVQMDLTFSEKAWPQAQRYHWFDFVSSTSTMHRLSKMDIKESCNEWVTDKAIENLRECVDAYNADKSKENFLRMIYNIPSGFELTARMTTNYMQLKNIYRQRRHHRLPDWQYFCDWIKQLPNSEFITGYVK